MSSQKPSLPNTKIKWLNGILILMLIIPLIIFSFLVPLHSDEMAYKWLFARYHLDKGIALSLYPHCFTQFEVKTPFLFLPARLLDAWIYGDLSSPLKLRLFGILNFSLWLSLVWVLCKRLFSKFALNQFQLSVSLVCLGTLPIMMTLNRPEQPLLLALTLSLLLPLYQGASFLKRGLLTTSLALLIIWFFPQHPKSLVFLPVFLVLCHYMQIPRINRYFLSVLATLMACTSFFFYRKQSACPANENIHLLFSSSLLSPTVFIKMPWFMTKQLIKNVLSIPKYVLSILFSNSVESNWLPSIEFPLPVYVLNSLIGFVFLGWTCTVIYTLIKNLKSQNKSWNLPYRDAISLVLLVVVFILSILQTSKNFYESTLILPVLILIGILQCQEYGFRLFPSNRKTLIDASLLGLSFLSVWTLMLCYLPSNLSDWKKGGQLEKQYISFSGFNWDLIEKQINQLANKCNLENNPLSKHLMLDDISYPFFTKTTEPYHANYITGYWAIGIDDLETFLKQRHSDGIVCQCKFLSEKVASRGYREGDFCCLPAFK